MPPAFAETRYGETCSGRIGDDLGGTKYKVLA
jgi:hypothetical protein